MRAVTTRLHEVGGGVGDGDGVAASLPLLVIVAVAALKVVTAAMVVRPVPPGSSVETLPPIMHVISMGLSPPPSAPPLLLFRAASFVLLLFPLSIPAAARNETSKEDGDSFSRLPPCCCM